MQRSDAVDTPAARNDARAATPWLVAIVALGIGLRLLYLGQPIRYDEAVTYLVFASRSWGGIISSYDYPNNHVLHSLFVKAVTAVGGGDPWVIRLPALLAGIAIIPMTYLAGRRLVGSRAALIGSAVVSVSGGMVLYSTNGRGYTMVSLAAVVLGWLLLRLRERSSMADWIAVVAVTTAGMWTIPTMLYPAGALALWFLLSAVTGDTSDPRGDARRILLAVLATTLATAACYAPIVLSRGIAPLTSNTFVAGSPWHLFFPELVQSIWSVGKLFTLGTPQVVIAVAVACISIALGADRTRRVRMTIAAYCWCAAVLLVVHRTPFPRVWLPFLPFAALLMGLGIDTLTERAKATVTARYAVSLGVAAAGAVLLYFSKGVLTSRETGTLRDAQTIASDFGKKLGPTDRLIALVPSNAPLQYYFLRAGVDTAVFSSRPITGAVYFIVNLGEGQSIQTSVPPSMAAIFQEAEAVASYPSAAIYRMIPKRRGE